MTDRYTTIPLEQAAKLLSGGTPRKSNPDYWDGPIPWLTPKDMADWNGVTENTVTEQAIGNGTRLAPDGATFIAVRGMSLHNEIRVIRSTKQFAFNQDIKAVIAEDGILPEFLYYALVASKRQLLEWVSAAGHGTGVLATDRLLSVPVPQLDEGAQRSIANVLSALDDKIELNRQMNETLEALAQAVFKDWFVTFGPVRRKQEGATDPIAILGGLIPDPAKAAPVAALFPDGFGEDGLPEGWSAKPLGDFASSVGKTLQPSEIAPRTPYFGLEHLPRNSIMLSQWGEAKTVKSGKSSFRKRQILFGKLRPYFHKVGMAPVDGVCSTDIVVLDAKDAHDRAFVTCLVSSEAFVAFTDLGSEGTKMPRTSWSKMSTYMVAAGNSKTREAFGTLVEPLHDKILASISENRTLAATRDYLLPKLMSGEVRVRDAEKTVS